jgi:DNA-binding CsgD family transcriptional regulator
MVALVDLLKRIEQVCSEGHSERALRVAVLTEIRSLIPFDFYAWLLTDPVTCVGWSPVAEVPVLAEIADVIQAKYLTTINRWTDLVPGVAVTLAGACAVDTNTNTNDTDANTNTNAEPDGRTLWELLQSRYSVTDVASVVLRDKTGCWGFVDLWRRGGTFGSEECQMLEAVMAVVTPALRRALLATFAASRVAPSDGPVVMLLDSHLRPVGQTPSTDRYLHALLPTDPGQVAVPAAAFNVGAQLCALEAGVSNHPPQARVFVADQTWMTVRAGRIDADAANGAIAVTIEPTAPADRTDLYARVAGLTEREAAVLNVVIAGDDTRHSAHRLGISEHTLQDHLKAIFTKTGTSSRRLLTARATGTPP